MFLSMKRDPKNLKSSKKFVGNNKQNFGKKRNDELKGSKGEKFWNIWKSCDGNIRNKSPNFCDGSKWESFYSKLFKDPNSNNNINTPNVSVKKKISEKIHPF